MLGHRVVTGAQIVCTLFGLYICIIGGGGGARERHYIFPLLRWLDIAPNHVGLVIGEPILVSNYMSRWASFRAKE